MTRDADAWWDATFAGPDDMTRIEPGYYGDLRRYPFHNPVQGGLDFSGDGRGCNELYGWFEVDEVAYDDQGTLQRLALRFEQHCEHPDAPPLRGEIRFDRSAPIPPPPNPQPAPDGSWRPAPEAAPDADSTCT